MNGKGNEQEYEEALVRLALIWDRSNEETRLDKLDDQLKSDAAYAVPELDRKQLRAIGKALRREQRRQIRAHIHTHRRAALAAAVCLIVLLSVSVGVFGKDVANFIVEMRERYISRTYGLPEADYTDYSGSYMPSYKPDGYWISKKKGDHGLTVITYQGADENDRILYEQNDNRVCQYLDSEHAVEVSDLVIQGKPGQRLLYADGEVTLIWGEHPYFLISSASAEEAELWKMAESVVLVP